MKVNDLKPRTNINLRVRVCSKGNERTITKNRYSPLRVCEFKVGDDSGEVTLTMFNDDIDKLANAVGKVIDITDGWSKSWQGNIQLSMGKNGCWNVVNDKSFPTAQAILQGLGSAAVVQQSSMNQTSQSQSPLVSSFKVKDLKSNSNVNVRVRICSKEQERVITDNRAIPLRVCNFTVGDETGHLNLTMFNDGIDKLSSFVGQVVDLKDGWTKMWQGDLQISMGRSGSFEPVKDKSFPSVSKILPSTPTQNVNLASTNVYADVLDFDSDQPSSLKVSQILPNMNISTKVRVCDQKRIKYKNQRDGTRLRIREFLMGDETGMISYSAFNEEIDELGKVMGQVVELENCWSKFWDKSLHISKGQNGTLKAVDDKNFPSKQDLLNNYQKTQLELLNELSPGMVYYSSIKGIRFQENGKMVYSKEAMTELELVPEPENPYDDKAVGIWLDGKQVGYVPRTQNKAVFKALIDGDPDVKCYLGIFVPTHDTGFNLPHHVKDMPITLSTHIEILEWRPVILLPEDTMAF